MGKGTHTKDHLHSQFLHDPLPVPHPRTSHIHAHLFARQLFPIEINGRCNASDFLFNDLLRLLLHFLRAKKIRHTPEGTGCLFGSKEARIYIGNLKTLLDKLGNVGAGTLAMKDVQLDIRYLQEIFHALTSGKYRYNTATKFLKKGFDIYQVPVHIEFTDNGNVVRSHFIFFHADFRTLLPVLQHLIIKLDIEMMVARGLAHPAKAWCIDDKYGPADLFFNFSSHRITIIPDKPAGAGSINQDTCCAGDKPPGLKAGLLQLLHTAKNHILFLKVGGDCPPAIM